MIDYRVTDRGVAVLTWNLPDRPVNVMNDDSLAQFARLIEQALADAAVKGIVVASAKRDFVTGADLVSFLSDRRPAVIFEKSRASQALLRRLETGGKPVCAALNGSALGGGLEIALACHRRIAADSPSLRLGLPEVTLGLLPGAGGTQRLPRLIGLRKALPLLLEGRTLGVAQAREQGLVDAVVPAEQLLDAACAWVAEQTEPVTQPWDRKGFKLPGGMPDPVGIYGIFAMETARISARTQNKLPAPRHILSAVFEGYSTDIDSGLKAERRHFVGCACSSASKNIIRTSFFGVNDAAKLKHRPAGVPPLALQALGVAGDSEQAGAFAQAAAEAGLPVVWVLGAGQAADAAKSNAAGGIRIAANVDALRECQFVIVADGSDATALRDRIRTVVGHGVAVAQLLSDAHAEFDAGIGLRLGQPGVAQRLLEVQRAAGANDVEVAHAMDLAKRLRWVPLLSVAVGGGYLARLQRAYRGEGQAMLAEGVAPVLIGNAAKQAGMAAAPVAVPPAATPAHVAALPTDQAAAQAAGNALQQRLLHAQAIEALRCLEEGVVASALDADIGAQLGCGFPTYLGGPIGHVDTVGVTAFIEQCRSLASRHGTRFEPPASLLRQQASGGGFHRD